MLETIMMMFKLTWRMRCRLWHVYVCCISWSSMRHHSRKMDDFDIILFHIKKVWHVSCCKNKTLYIWNMMKKTLMLARCWIIMYKIFSFKTCLSFVLNVCCRTWHCCHWEAGARCDQERWRSSRHGSWQTVQNYGYWYDDGCCFT